MSRMNVSVSTLIGTLSFLLAVIVITEVAGTGQDIAEAGDAMSTSVAGAGQDIVEAGDAMSTSVAQFNPLVTSISVLSEKLPDAVEQVGGEIKAFSLVGTPFVNLSQIGTPVADIGDNLEALGTPVADIGDNLEVLGTPFVDISSIGTPIADIIDADGNLSVVLKTPTPEPVSP